MDRRLPFFFYGTLQTGFHNNTFVIRERLIPRTDLGRLPHTKVYHYMHAGHPGAYELLEDEEKKGDCCGSILGQVFDFPDIGSDKAYAEVLSELDHLEEFKGSLASNNTYERVARMVSMPPTTQEHVLCWVYLSNIKRGDDSVLLPDGNWSRFMAETGFPEMVGKALNS